MNQASSVDNKTAATWAKRRKLATCAALGCLFVALVVCVAGSPDLYETMLEFLSTFQAEPGVSVERDLIYFSTPEAGVPAELHSGDLYLPVNNQVARAAVVVVHGGSWCAGSKNDLPETIMSRFFSLFGFVVFNINYRTLDHGGQFPADVIDVKRAVAFLLSNKDRWHIDSQRLVTTGTSSGSYAAMMAAYTPNVKPFAVDELPVGSKLKIFAVGSFSGPTDFEKLSANKYLQKYLQKMSGSYAERLKKASPITYAKTGVPTFFAHGSEDNNVPLQQSVAMAAALGKEHIDCTFVRIEGAGHFVGGNSRRLVLERMLNFLTRLKSADCLTR